MALRKAERRVRRTFSVLPRDNNGPPGPLGQFFERPDDGTFLRTGNPGKGFAHSLGGLNCGAFGLGELFAEPAQIEGRSNVCERTVRFIGEGSRLASGFAQAAFEITQIGIDANEECFELGHVLCFLWLSEV